MAGTRIVVGALVVGVWILGSQAVPAIAVGGVTNAGGLKADARNDPPGSVMTERSVRDAIASSPRDYVAALIEQVEDQRCERRGDQTDCTFRARIVDFIAGRYHGEPWPETRKELVIFNGHGPANRDQGMVGQKMVVFAILLTGEGETYGMTLGDNRCDVDHVGALRRVVNRVLGLPEGS